LERSRGHHFLNTEIHFMPREKKSARVSRMTERTAGGSVTSGNIRRRTTCAVSAISDGRVEAARLWVFDPDGRAVSKEQFISQAIDEKTRRVLAENPRFQLPEWCAFDMAESVEANA
jgi:hypothetical protein